MDRKKAAKRAEVTLGTSVHTRHPFKSGSKILEEDFLFLRSIWPKVSSADRRNALDAEFRKADEYLEGIAEFDNHSDAIDDEIPPKYTANLGIFLLNSVPTNEKRAYDSNEALVNASLVNFLQAVCAKHPDVR